MDDFTIHSVRFPSDLRKHLKVRALTHGRSFNAEVIYILKKTLIESAQLDEEIARVMHSRPLRVDT